MHSGKANASQRDRHIIAIAEHGRMNWQKESGYNLRARAEFHIGRFKAVIGDSLRSRTPMSRDTEIAVATNALNKMLGFGRPYSVRIA
jgi:hypothetical protein